MHALDNTFDLMQRLSESCLLSVMCVWAKHVTVLGQQKCCSCCRALVIYADLRVNVTGGRLAPYHGRLGR
jgi:hypothetical protein